MNRALSRSFKGRAILYVAELTLFPIPRYQGRLADQKEQNEY